MSKSGMLRTRRRDVNIKPNRRLDRKSSRGMIYENEELRLRTININAEIERGQSDIKKLRRENEQLRKEIWCLRDEYEKLDKLLKEKEHDETSCSSCTSDTESCSSETSENETVQNQENVQKTVHSLRTEFDHLSVVTEETSAELSDRNSAGTNSLTKDPTTWNILPPDDTYPAIGPGIPSQGVLPPGGHLRRVDENIPSIQEDISGELFQGVEDRINIPREPGLGNHLQGPYEEEIQKNSAMKNENMAKNFFAPWPQYNGFANLQPCEKGGSDLIVKDTAFGNISQESQGSTNSFVNGGNLEELLQDIHTISNDILQISDDINKNQDDDPNKPYKTELNVVLMPKPMPLLGFEKYDELKNSIDNLKKSSENLQNLDTKNIDMSKINDNFCLAPYDNSLPYSPPMKDVSTISSMPKSSSNPFKFVDNFQSDKYDSYDNLGFKTDSIEKNHCMSEIDVSAEVNGNNENVEIDKNPNKNESDKKDIKKDPEKSPKMKKTRKVSIYFKGKKDKLKRSLSLDTKNIQRKSDELKIPPSPITPKKEIPLQKADSKNSIFETNPSKTDDKIINSDAKNSTDSKNSYERHDRKHRKSSSTSPERRHHAHDKKGHKKRHKKSERQRAQGNNSVSLDRQRDRSYSVCTDRSHILDHRFGQTDEYTNSERERTNSLSSCESIKSRKNSIPNFQVGGKIPWFGCWGNGCI